jgi:hypothetical protein
LKGPLTGPLPRSLRRPATSACTYRRPRRLSLETHWQPHETPRYGRLASRPRLNLPPARIFLCKTGMRRAVSPRRLGALKECTSLMHCTARVQASPASSLPRSAHFSPSTRTTMGRARLLDVFRWRVEVRLTRLSSFSIGGRPCRSLRRFPPSRSRSAWPTSHCSPSAGPMRGRARTLGVFRSWGRGPPAARGVA